MKKLIYILSLLTLIVLISCERKLDSENISKITTYPIVELLGDEMMIVNVGGTFTDPGVKATIGTEEVDYTTEGTVNTDIPGTYTIKYTAVNAEGFNKVVSRIVGVITPEAASDDLSGDYQRNAGRKGISTWTKEKDGLYKVIDIGGALLPGDYVFVFNVEKDIIMVPRQNLSGADGNLVYCLDADGNDKIAFTPGGAGTESYTWVIYNGGYGTAARVFVKQ